MWRKRPREWMWLVRCCWDAQLFGVQSDNDRGACITPSDKNFRVGFTKHNYEVETKLCLVSMVYRNHQQEAVLIDLTLQDNLLIVTLTENVKSSQNLAMHINWRLISLMKVQKQEDTEEWKLILKCLYSLCTCVCCFRRMTVAQRNDFIIFFSITS